MTDEWRRVRPGQYEHADGSTIQKVDVGWGDTSWSLEMPDGRLFDLRTLWLAKEIHGEEGATND